MNKCIYFAGGCFWGTEAYFSMIKGVINTQCGYANGTTKNPTYEEVCAQSTNHAETVMVEYDDSVITLDKLLNEFFKIINPTAKNRQGNDIGNQYRSGIYYSNASDSLTINNFIESKKYEYDRPIVTEVLPLSCFYPAEDYHQHYLDKNPGGYCHVDLSLIKKEDRK